MLKAILIAILVPLALAFGITEEANAQSLPEWVKKLPPLHQAAFQNNVAKVRRLIANGASIRATSENGYTPLHIAAQMNASNVAVLLMNNGANIHATDNYGQTPFHLAAWGNASDMAVLLMNNGANIHATTNNGATPLHFAAQQNASDVASFLLRNGANIHAKTHGNWTPLHTAAWKNRAKSAAALLAHGANTYAKTEAGETPLDIANREGHNLMQTFLNKCKPAPNERAEFDRIRQLQDADRIEGITGNCCALAVMTDNFNSVLKRCGYAAFAQQNAGFSQQHLQCATKASDRTYDDANQCRALIGTNYRRFQAEVAERKEREQRAREAQEARIRAEREAEAERNRAAAETRRKHNEDIFANIVGGFIKGYVEAQQHADQISGSGDSGGGKKRGKGCMGGDIDGKSVSCSK